MSEIQEKYIRLLYLLNEEYRFTREWFLNGCSHGFKPAEDCNNKECRDKEMHSLWEELTCPQSLKENKKPDSSMPDKPTAPPQMPPHPYHEAREDQELKMLMAKDMFVAVLPQLIQTNYDPYTKEQRIAVVDTCCTYSEMIFNRFKKWI